MKILRNFIPHFSIALNVSLLVVIYCDLRNPMMGFLVGTPFLVLVGACVVCSIISALILCVGLRSKKARENPVKNKD